MAHKVHITENKGTKFKACKVCRSANPITLANPIICTYNLTHIYPTLNNGPGRYGKIV